MKQQVILSDENCSGQAEAIFAILEQLGFRELLNLELLTFEAGVLVKGTGDEQIWRFCQENHYLLLTGNRTTKARSKSLEFAIRYLVTSTSLPVLTIGNLKRVLRDRDYCGRCAERLADIVFDLERHYGIPRVFLP